MFNKSTLFLIVLILPIALSSDLFARLENTEEGKTVLNTLLIQTKLHGISADSIKTVLTSSQKNNDNGLEKFEAQAKIAKESCQNDLKVLRDSLNENVSKRYSIEKTAESTTLLKNRKSDYIKQLETELNDYTEYEKEIDESHKAWTDFFTSMHNSILSAEKNLAQIKLLVEHNNPQNSAASFVEVKNRESAIAEIKSNLEFRFYDTLGMKPILSNLLEVVSKGISSTQFHKISKTIDMIENFLANRKNNLIEDNEYQSQYSANLKNSITDSKTSTTSEKNTVNSLISSLETRLGLLTTSLTNAKTLVNYAQNVYDARKKICENFDSTYFNHIRRYNNVRLTIAELSNSFDDEYRDFTTFIQQRMLERN